MPIVSKAPAALCLAAALLCPACPESAAGPRDGAGSARSMAHPAAREAEAALSEAVRALGLQTRLPGNPDEDTLPALLDVVERIPPYRPEGRNVVSVARAVLWLSVLVAAAVILFNLQGNLWSSSRARRLIREERGDAAPASTAARMDKARVEADDLAMGGNYAEAMHTLLLRSVSELRGRLDAPIAASLTSREILHHVRLSPDARACFADIIGRVEISYFGAHQPGEDDYLACRRSFEALRGALRRKNPA